MPEPEADWVQLEADLIETLTKSVGLDMTQVEADRVLKEFRTVATRQRALQRLRALWRLADTLRDGEPDHEKLADEIVARVKAETKALGIEDGIP